MIRSRSWPAVAVALVLALAGPGCQRHGDASSAGDSDHPVPKQIWLEFSGSNAFTHTEKLVDLGPRPSGSAADEKARDYIRKTVTAAGWEVTDQAFTDITPRGPIKFVNLIARYPGGAGRAAPADTQEVVVCSHFDTKIFDTIRFVGASDGGSSTGALIELARVLALNPAMARKVELVFFDGEEAVVAFTESDGTYGSRHYARDLRLSNRNKQFKFGVLWDMIGNKGLTVTLSTDSPPDLTRGIFASADTLHLRDRFKYFHGAIWDDQVPLTHEAGISTIDLIDLSYEYWHTAADTMDKMSPESMQVVGEVTLHYLDGRIGK